MKALKNAERAALREKFGGRCAYCGCELGKRWHADHIEPVIRCDWMALPRGPDFPERHTIENMNPAFAPCNIDKHTLSLESWRMVIQRSNEVLATGSGTFRRAMRFGLVRLVDEPVRFYFETLGDS